MKEQTQRGIYDLAQTPSGEIKSENCDGTDFKMGVAATLPELSEWILLPTCLYIVSLQSLGYVESR